MYPFHPPINLGTAWSGPFGWQFPILPPPLLPFYGPPAAWHVNHHPAPPIHSPPTSPPTDPPAFHLQPAPRPIPIINPRTARNRKKRARRNKARKARRAAAASSSLADSESGPTENAASSPSDSGTSNATPPAPPPSQAPTGSNIPELFRQQVWARATAEGCTHHSTHALGRNLSFGDGPPVGPDRDSKSDSTADQSEDEGEGEGENAKESSKM